MSEKALANRYLTAIKAIIPNVLEFFRDSFN
jgi:hypothetical protein